MNAPSTEGFRPNQFRQAGHISQPGVFREGRWRLFEPPAPVVRTLAGQRWRLRPGLTFTPYANPTPCNARCAFCSEELLRKDGDRLTARTPIGDHDRYFAALARAWSELAGFPMGLSLSGLEATSDPAWMLRLLARVRDHADLFPERVLYSNGTGLATHPALIDALEETRFDRVELSRCHFDEDTNQRLMRFRRSEPIRQRRVLEQVVARLLAGGQVAIKLSCILNRQGTATLADVEAYVAQAAALGVPRIVFRELSTLGDDYWENREHRWIAQNRVQVRDLLEEIQPDSGAIRDGWTFLGATLGYYYYNEVYRHRGVEIILEGSSYTAHHLSAQSGVVQKLVFHSTGDLCGDWVPNALVIGNYNI